MFEELYYDKLPTNFYTADLKIYTTGTHLQSGNILFDTKEEKDAVVARLKKGERLWTFNRTVTSEF